MQPKRGIRKVWNDDNSVDLIIPKELFTTEYMVGCLIKYDEGEAIVRVVGPVKDLSKVVLKGKYE